MVTILIIAVFFTQFFICTAVYSNEVNIDDREGQWILQSQITTGVGGTIVLFIVVTLITGVLFEQYLICTVV